MSLEVFLTGWMLLSPRRNRLHKAPLSTSGILASALYPGQAVWHGIFSLARQNAICRRCSVPTARRRGSWAGRRAWTTWSRMQTLRRSEVAFLPETEMTRLAARELSIQTDAAKLPNGVKVLYTVDGRDPFLAWASADFGRLSSSSPSIPKPDKP
eukprot:s1933_g1.t1